MKILLKKGDNVQLITGNDNGKSGEIIKIFPENYKVLVKGLNVKKKHQKPTKEKKGGIISIEAPIHISNVKLLSSNKKTNEKPKTTKKEEIKPAEVKKEKIETKAKVEVKKEKKTTTKKSAKKKEK